MAGADPALIVKVGANLDDLKTGLTAADTAVQTFATQTADSLSAAGDKSADSLRRLKQATDEVGQSTSVLSGLQQELVSIFAVSKLVDFGASVMELGGHLVKTADQTGLTIEQVQKLEYVAQQSSTGMGSLTSAVQALEAKLGSSDSGTIKAIENLGLRMEAFTQLNAYEQFLQVADAIKQIQDPTEQAAAAADVFGRNWKEILPAIKAGMQEVGDQAAIMSDETAKKLDKLGASMGAMNTQLKVWASGIVTGIDKASYAVGNWLSQFDPAHFGITNDALNHVYVALNNVTGATQEAAGATKEHTQATVADAAATTTSTAAKNENVQSSKQQAAETKAWKQLMDEFDKTTFQLAMQHDKQWREEIEKTKNARNAAVVDALTKTKAAELDLADYIAKTTLSTTDYQIKKINDWVDAQLAAYDQSMGNYDRYAAAILGKAELQKQALVTKAMETQAAIDQVILPDSPIGHGPEDILPWSNLLRPIGGTSPGGTIALGGIADVSAAVKAFYDSFIGNSAGTPGVGSYGNAAGPAGWNMPRMLGMASGGSVAGGTPYVVGEQGPEVFVPSTSGAIVPSGGTSVTNIYITQPLGTPQAIAAAVGSAQMAAMKGRGERFRPSGV